MEWFSFLKEGEQEELRNELQSFLKWVHTYNPDFTEHLTTEELSNAWLHDFEHPDWVEKNKKNFLFLVHLNEYIEEFKKNASLFVVTTPPKRKTKEETTNDRITPKQLKYLLFLSKQKRRPIPDVKNLTKKEASKLISELLSIPN